MKPVRHPVRYSVLAARIELRQSAHTERAAWAPACDKDCAYCCAILCA
ncbi:hypothetical protein [Streptomyces sp. NPDC001843]